MSTGPSRRRLLATAACCGAWLGAPRMTRAQQMDRVGAWFKLLGSVLEEWQVETASQDALRCTIRRRGASASGRLVYVFYPRKSSAYDVAMTTILEAFSARGVDATFEVLNFEQKDERGLAAIREAEKAGCNLIFTMGSESTEWFWKKARDITIPVVSVCSKDPVLLGQMKDYENGSGNSFAFTSLNLVLDVQLAYLRQLKPGLRNVAILVDSRNVSAMETQATPFAEACRRLGVDAFLVAVKNPAEAARELATLVPEAVERMRASDPGLESSLFWVTGSTSVFTEMATINRGAGNVPVLSAVPDVVQEGPDSAVISIGVSFENNARLAAIYAQDILAGRARASDLKVGVLSPPDIAVNFLRAREIGLKIPFSFFEMSENVYGPDGRRVRERGQSVALRGQK